MKDSGNTMKIDLKVQFPLQINMLPYTSRARSQDTRENFELARSCTYDLLSVVVHVGTIDTGHYISYSRVGNQVSHIHSTLDAMIRHASSTDEL
jgi:ubiquitin carboxyl-terminal hydrolase 22/27/51